MYVRRPSESNGCWQVVERLPVGNIETSDRPISREQRESTWLFIFK